MSQKQRNQVDFDYLFASGQAGKALGLSHFLHLDQPIGIWNYIRIAEDIADQTYPGSLLDWGCGHGQMTYLLRRRGFQVTPFDLAAPGKPPLPDIPLCRNLEVVRSTHPTRLPFPDRSFTAVLSCGVLEHVDQEVVSLREIARILRPGGLLLIYQLPQLYAWQETVIRRFNLGYAHPRRYTAKGSAEMLEKLGFSVQRQRRANLIPRNLTGMPQGLRTFYSRFSKPLLWLDGRLCQIPGLNHLAGVLEITARREQ